MHQAASCAAVGAAWWRFSLLLGYGLKVISCKFPRDGLAFWSGPATDDHVLPLTGMPVALLDEMPPSPTTSMVWCVPFLRTLAPFANFSKAFSLTSVCNADGPAKWFERANLTCPGLYVLHEPIERSDAIGG